MAVNFFYNLDDSLVKAKLASAFARSISNDSFKELVGHLSHIICLQECNLQS
jgi:hypothetical protein